MTKISHLVALVATLGAMPLHAAPDTGLVWHDTGIGQLNTGVGATVGIRIQLGPDRIVKKSERVKLGIATGPVFVLPDPYADNGIRRGEASFVGIELKPGYTTSLNFAGRPIAVDYTQLGAAEKEKDDDDEGKQGTVDKIGWVALVAGGVALGIYTVAFATQGPYD